MKTYILPYILLVLLLAILMTSGFHESARGQSAAGSAMINGVLAHGMSPAEAQLMANSNISWVSCDVTFNPSDISRWYQVYALAQQYHLSVLGILDQHLMNYSNTFTLADWSNAVTKAVVDFGGVVKTWEIWNEPNYPNSSLGYFSGSPQSYVSMLQVAYNNIKAIAPSDTVIGLGGMPLYTADNPTFNNSYALQAYAWAQQVVQLGGMSYCDDIAVHAYPYGQYYPFLAGVFFSSYLQQYQQLCNKPIWVTEVGQESSSTTWAATEPQQSLFLSQSYSLFQGLNVKAYMWYELNDNYTAIPDSNFGLFDNNGNQKSAFDTFVNAVNGLTSSTAIPTTVPTTMPNQSPTPTPFDTSTSSPSPTPAVPEFPSWIILILFITVTLPTLSVCLKRVKRQK